MFGQSSTSQDSHVASTLEHNLVRTSDMTLSASLNCHKFNATPKPLDPWFKLCNIEPCALIYHNCSHEQVLRKIKTVFAWAGWLAKVTTTRLDKRRPNLSLEHPDLTYVYMYMSEFVFMGIYVFIMASCSLHTT